MVESVKRNDKKKDKMAQNMGYVVIRLWGSEIKTNATKVVKDSLGNYL